MSAAAGYDIIGDVHGHAELLERLLTQLGYRHKNGAWRHPDRTALFAGDLIDRGPESVRAVRIVRAMIDADAARCVMGNHEYNAVCFFTPHPDKPGEYLRRNFSQKNRRQHGRFLAEVGERSPLHAELVAWFKTLPLWLELDDLCLVHACWSEAAMALLRPRMEREGVLTDDLYPDSIRPGPLREAVKELCKGPEIEIADAFIDKDGNERDKARVCWWREWDTDGVWTMRDGGCEVKAPLPKVQPRSWPVRKPVFFGHYWLSPEAPKVPKSPRHACLDFSAGKGGPLVCYRFDAGDTDLTALKFVSV